MGAFFKCFLTDTIQKLHFWSAVVKSWDSDVGGFMAALGRQVRDRFIAASLAVVGIGTVVKYLTYYRSEYHPSVDEALDLAVRVESMHPTT